MSGLWETLSVEIAHAARRTLRRPGFMLVSSVTLGLALGASVMAFAILYGYLFRPLPYVNANQLLVPRQRVLKTGLLGPQVSVQFYHKLTQIPEFRGAGLMNMTNGIVSVNGQREFARFTDLTPSTFTLLGIKPLLGATLSAGSGAPGGPHEVVLSYAYWQSAFDGKPNVLGKSLKVDGTVMQIVGVMPKGFVFPIAHTAFWAPFVITPAMEQDGNVNYEMLARMPRGWTLARVNAFLTTMRDRTLSGESPAEQARAINLGYTIDAVPYRQVLLDSIGGSVPLWGLFSITLLLLFLATLNSTNLALARQRQRLGELHLRQILGAGPAALLRMMLLEYLPVLVGMGVIAAALSGICIGLLHAFQLPSPDLPFEIRFGPATIVYLVVAANIVVLCIAGAAIATAALNRSPGKALQELSQRGTASRAFRNTQRVFGAAQICIALVLIICSALLSQSLLGLLHQPLHFDSRQITTATIILPHTTNPQQFWQAARAQFNNLPGTKSAAISDMVPFGSKQMGGGFQPYGEPERHVHAWYVTASPEFFATLGVPALAGRLFTQTDERPQPTGSPTGLNVIVSEALAHFWFGRSNAVGKTLQGNLHIVGVVPTLPWQLDPTANNHGYAVYLPIWVYQSNEVSILISSSASPSALYPAIHQALAKVQPDAILYRLQTVPQIMAQSSLNRSALTWFVVSFGGLAFLIAVFGVYAIVAYGTRLRLFEFAIRQVLGASRGAVIALTLRETALLLLVGGVVGILIAYVIARGLNSLLYGVGTLDPLAYLGSLALIVVAVLIAATLPAWRATLKNPADIMREQP